MRNISLLILSSMLFLGCGGNKTEKTLIPRALNSAERFDEFPKSQVEIFVITKVDSGENQLLDKYEISFKDTLLSVNKAPKPLATKFLNPRFINSQKTAVVAQVADDSGMVSPFYVFSSKNGVLEAIELDRKSNGKFDAKITRGLEEYNRSSFIINNDFLITTINGKIYPIKREVADERLAGKLFMMSRDKATLIFVTPNSLYQYNYMTDESVDLKVDPNLLKQEVSLAQEIQTNYVWFKKPSGALFLKAAPDSDRIVDIKEFKN